MNKHKIFFISALLLSGMSLTHAESEDVPTITAEVFSIELPDNGVATIVKDDTDTCTDDHCKRKVLCSDDPNVEDCYTE